MARLRSAVASARPPEIRARASARTTSAAARSARESAGSSIAVLQAATSSEGAALLPSTQSMAVPAAAAGPAAANARPRPRRPVRCKRRGKDSWVVMMGLRSAGFAVVADVPARVHAGGGSCKVPLNLSCQSSAKAQGKAFSRMGAWPERNIELDLENEIVQARRFDRRRPARLLHLAIRQAHR